MYINTMFVVIDILVAELEQINLDDVATRRQLSFEAGFKEPSFWDSFEGQMKLRRVIRQQDLYRYGSASFNPSFREREQKISQEMFYTYRKYWTVARKCLRLSNKL